ncbi:histidinol-phosphate transaminase [Schaalia sp. lx-100]|uniref:histidinol-phosphate transaminase n=1 Tax=Schaalia sp. lx-100 TaxID=2899081 RepID=UPI001E4803FF|nr:histidinol-phosphate transaminase [Schaalia sp. lx-100]MCD4556902.1 histidinol-phosphate transaminase [Schaalia sp. lx-100]
MSITLPLRADLAGLSPYGAPQLDIPVCLNVNENPYSPSEHIIADIAQALSQTAAGLNRYPDRDFWPLRAALADYLRAESHVQVSTEKIWAANGSNEIMLHILQAFGGPDRSVLSFTPTYSMYHEYARDTHTRWVSTPRRSDFTLDIDAAIRTMRQENPAVVIIASPNNPTGTALPLADIAQLLEAARDTGPLIEGKRSATLVVIDEAYAEFRRVGMPSALELHGAHPHLIVTRTMSKAFAMAGLRLGYMVAHPEVLEQILLIRLPYHLSAVTQAVALVAIKHADELMSQVAAIRADRDAMAQWLVEQGCKVAESDANFVLFGRFDDRDAIFRALVERGVLIRAIGPEGWLRVSVGTPAENTRFQSALLEVLP